MRAPSVARFSGQGVQRSGLRDVLLKQTVHLAFVLAWKYLFVPSAWQMEVEFFGMTGSLRTTWA